MKQPGIFDVQYFGERLFLLDHAHTLIELDLEGNVLRAWWFSGPQGDRLPFTTFAVLPGRRVILGHPYLKWGQDLWQGTL